MRTPFKVGLTGGLASGKSTVARRLAETGADVADADAIVRDLYRPGHPGARAVEELFGADYLTAEGAVDARQVAARVFHDADARLRLEHAIHPLVRDEFRRHVERTSPAIAVMEATRLVEAGFAPDFDLVVSVEADRAIRRRRAIERGHTPEDADARLDVQGSGAERRRAAHRILRNDAGLAELERATRGLIEELETRSQGRSFALEAFVFVTGNPGKLAEARRLAGADLDSVALDLPEIQSLDLEQVLRVKGEEAFLRLGRAVVVEETGLAITGLNGFPGPLVRWMLEAIGPEGVARQAIASGDPHATACCALLYVSATVSVLAVGENPGRLTLPARGSHGFGWDPVFEDASTAKTYGELSDAEKDALGHRGRAWRKLLVKLGPLGGFTP